MQELIDATLVEEVPNLGCHYQLTTRAWQMLLARVQDRADQLERDLQEIYNHPESRGGVRNIAAAALGLFVEKIQRI